MKKAEQEKIIALFDSIDLTHVKKLHKKIAATIQDKMETCGLSQLMDGKYFIRPMRNQTHGDCSYLAMHADDYCGTIVDLTSSTDSTRDSSYLFGDFGLRYNSPALEDVRVFLSDLEEIYAELKEVEKTEA